MPPADDVANQASAEVDEMMREDAYPGGPPFDFDGWISRIEDSLKGPNDLDPDDPAFWHAVIAELEHRRNAD